MGKSTLSFHLRRLEKAGLVENRDDGYALRDPEAVGRLLSENQPTPDLLDRFSNLWDDLYGE
jgi:DNA-binding transcriptional ArsR family regulator